MSLDLTVCLLAKQHLQCKRIGEKNIHGLHFASVNVSGVMEQEALRSMGYLQVLSHRP